MTGRAVDAAVVGVGARAANGLTPLQVCMSIRANRLVVRETRFRDRNGEAIGVCHVASVDPELVGAARLAALAAPSLVQATWAWRAARGGGALPVVLAAGERARPGHDPQIERSLLVGIEARSGVAVDHARSTVLTTGRAAGAAAIARADELLDAGVPAVIVGGVDSYHDADALEWLDAELRLHGMETENGLLPGEASAFLLLVRRDARGALPVQARVLAVGTATEPHPYGDDEPCIGVGATTALRDALAAGKLGPRSVEATVSDVANERHRVDEWLYARTREHEAFVQDAPEEQPLLVTGDVGAASLPLLIAWCATSWGAGSWAPSVAALGVHSDGAHRGAAIVART